MKIEKMQLADLEEVVKLENELFKDPWSKEFFINDLNNEVASYFVLKDENKVIGYAGLWQMFEDCDLVNIAISSAYQGQGLGEKLLRFMLKKAIEKGCEFMHLEVRVSNIKAKNLYEKYGFEALRIREGYYENGEDCIDMMKGLLGLNAEDFSD